MRNLDAPTIRHALYVSLAVAFSSLIFSVFGSALGDVSAFVSTLVARVARPLARLMNGDVVHGRKNGLSSFAFSLPKAA